MKFEPWFLAILLARGVRGLAYGSIPVVLGLTLAHRGFSPAGVGVLLTCALLTGAFFSFLSGALSRRFGIRGTLIGSALLMCASGALFAFNAQQWASILAISAGTIAAGGQDVGPFAALEQTVIAHASTSLGAERYSIYNAVALAAVAIGAALAAFIPIVWVLIAYALAAACMALAYAALPHIETTPQPLWRGGASRPRSGAIERLTALFALDAFAGGFIAQSVIAYWFSIRFGVGPAQLGVLLGIANGLAAASFFAASALARRFGLLNTMVFTHLPSNVLLFVVAVMPTYPLAAAALLARFALSQMDVPTRQAYVMSVADPDDRARAAGLTSAVRPAAAAFSPALSGVAIQHAAMGLPFFASGALKIAYDLLLFARFRGMIRPEVHMQEIESSNCPACGHPMSAHHGRHCKVCEEQGDQCLALDPAAESPGG